VKEVKMKDLFYEIMESGISIAEVKEIIKELKQEGYKDSKYKESEESEKSPE
jgi:hypothetical protein